MEANRRLRAVRGDDLRTRASRVVTVSTQLNHSGRTSVDRHDRFLLWGTSLPPAFWALAEDEAGGKGSLSVPHGGEGRSVPRWDQKVDGSGVAQAGASVTNEWRRSHEDPGAR